MYNGQTLYIVLCYRSPCWTCTAFKKSLNIGRLHTATNLNDMVTHFVKKRLTYKKKGVKALVRWHRIIFGKPISTQPRMSNNVYDACCDLDDEIYSKMLEEALTIVFFKSHNVRWCTRIQII